MSDGMIRDGKPTFTDGSLFDPKSWGVDLKWPGWAYESPPPLPPEPPAPPMMPLDDRWRTVSGPVAVLCAFSLGATLNWSCGRNVGESACAWRLAYSPHSRAFGIWCVIYLSTVGSIAVQLVDGFGPVTYAAEPWTNYLIAWSWILCGLWSIAFSNAESRDAKAGLGLAAFILASATITALGAVAIECSWRTQDPWRLIAVGVPYSIFAGWLSLACVLSIGIFIRSLTYRPDYECYRETSAYSTRLLADPVDRRSWSSAVPLLVATAVSIYAFMIPDPILPLPVAWGIVNMKGHVKNWVAIELLVVTSIACAVASVMDVWLWQ